MKKKLLLTGLVFTAVFLTAQILKVEAGVGENSNGWAWGGTDDGIALNTGVGWISMNSSDCDTDNNGVNDTCDFNEDGLVNSVDFVSIGSYGVKVPLVDGPLTGYAWSSNVGFIDFNPQDHCGSVYFAASCLAPDASAGNGGVRRVGDKLVGWARFVGIAHQSAINLPVGNSGGWDGWIKFGNGTDEVRIITGVSPNYLDGYVYNGEEQAGVGQGLGWINLTGTSFRNLPELTICRDSCVGGFPPVVLATDQNISMGSNKIFRACYGTSYDCTGSAVVDVTANPSTNWVGTNGPDDALDVSSGNVLPKAIGVEKIDVTYNPGTPVTKSFRVNVQPCSCTADNTRCPGDKIDSCGAATCTDGTMSCTTVNVNAWKEINP